MRVAILETFLLGFVLSVPVSGLWWLATGGAPSIVVLLALSWLLWGFLWACTRWRRTREARMLQEMYDQPSYGS